MGAEIELTAEQAVVLVVDSDPGQRTVMAGVLERAGYGVVEGESAADALTLAGRHHPVIVLLETSLPDGDGWEVAQKIKSDPAFSDVYVILLSAPGADGADGHPGRGNGLADGHIVQPVSPKVLLGWLETFIRIQTVQSALRAGEEKFRALFRNADAAACLCEIVHGGGRVADYRLLDVNPSFERVIGIDRARAVGALASVLYGMEEAPFLGACAVVAETGAPAKFEKLFAPLGRHVHVSVSSPGRGRFMMVFTDVAQRRQSEEDLKKLGGMLAGQGGAAGATSPGKIADLSELNRDGLILRALGAERLDAIAEECLELIGTSFFVCEMSGDYAVRKLASDWCCVMDRASRSLCGASGDAEALKSGKWLCHESCWTDASRRAINGRAPADIECGGGIRIYAVPVMSAGEVVGAAGFGYGDPPTDPARLGELAATHGLDAAALAAAASAPGRGATSGMVEMAKGRLQTTAQLMGSLVEMWRVEEQRRQLENHLRQAQKVEAVSRLSGGMAHDFNNMLNIVLGYADMALMKLPQGDPVRNDIQEIVRASQRSADLARQLLSFLGSGEAAPRLLDINEATAGMLKMLGKMIGEDISLMWRPGKEVWPVWMDPAQFDQILVNMAANARNVIAGTGKVTVETAAMEVDAAYCSAHPEVLPGQYALLAFSDNGRGMDRGAVEEIFLPYSSAAARGGVERLELATVYGIVKQNGGFVTVYSEPGHGTTFKIHLPRHHDATAPKRDEAPAAAPPKSAPGTETVLLVEDEAALLKLSEKLLTSLGYKVLAAASPVTALQMAQSHPDKIDLLLTDVVMPEMNGPSLRKQLELVLPGIKCMYMSGYTANVIANRGMLGEDVPFLQKPFSRAELAAKMREALGANG